MVPDVSELEAVMRYHERTKHHFNRYARGPGGLDWANQPDPFRRYAGAVLTRLPVLGARGGAGFARVREPVRARRGAG